MSDPSRTPSWASAFHIANNRRAPFALSDAGEVRSLIESAGFSSIDVRTLAQPTRFASPEALVAAQLAATPLSTLGAINDAAVQAIEHDVRAALETSASIPAR